MSENNCLHINGTTNNSIGPQGQDPLDALHTTVSSEKSFQNNIDKSVFLSGSWIRL